MAICDRHGLPLAVHVASASPYEPHLVPATLDARFVPELPPRLIGDRGYDSDRLDAQLRDQYGIEMIAPTLSKCPPMFPSNVFQGNQRPQFV